MKNSTKILIIDDEKAIVEVLAASLKDDAFIVDTAFSGRQGLQKIREFSPDIVLQDIWMPGDMDGLQVLEEVKKGGYPDCQFIIMSGHGTIETAVRAVKNGAWDFVEKPLSMDKITILIANILNFKREQSEKNALLTRLRKNIAHAKKKNNYDDSFFHLLPNLTIHHHQPYQHYRTYYLSHHLASGIFLLQNL